MILLRKIETPKYTKLVIAERFPGFSILGSKNGWFYPVEETKCVFVSTGFKSLVDDVRAHMKGNGIDVPVNLTEVMEDWWCMNVEAKDCGEPTPAHVADLRTLAQRFFRTAREFISDGGQRVDQEESERRAAICVGCPLNVDDGGWCSGCFIKAISATVSALFSGWSTSKDAKLKSCKLCGCRNALSVHIPLKNMRYPELEDKWPEWCWKKSSEG